MKNLNLILDDEDEEIITWGLVRLSKQLPDYELFFHINQINSNQFKRIDDLKISSTYYQHSYPRFEINIPEAKTCLQFIANQSSEFKQIKEITELFIEEEETQWLLPTHKDVDYIIKTSDTFADFSVILLPESLLFQIQDYRLSSNDELYQLIQYYE